MFYQFIFFLLHTVILPVSHPAIIKHVDANREDFKTNNGNKTEIDLRRQTEALAEEWIKIVLKAHSSDVYKGNGTILSKETFLDDQNWRIKKYCVTSKDVKECIEVGIMPGPSPQYRYPVKLRVRRDVHSEDDAAKTEDSASDEDEYEDDISDDYFGEEQNEIEETTNNPPAITSYDSTTPDTESTVTDKVKDEDKKKNNDANRYFCTGAHHDLLSEDAHHDLLSKDGRKHKSRATRHVNTLHANPHKPLEKESEDTTKDESTTYDQGDDDYGGEKGENDADQEPDEHYDYDDQEQQGDGIYEEQGDGIYEEQGDGIYEEQGDDEYREQDDDHGDEGDDAKEYYDHEGEKGGKVGRTGNNDKDGKNKDNVHGINDYDQGNDDGDQKKDDYDDEHQDEDKDGDKMHFKNRDERQNFNQEYPDGRDDGQDYDQEHTDGGDDGQDYDQEHTDGGDEGQDHDQEHPDGGSERQDYDQDHPDGGDEGQDYDQEHPDGSSKEPGEYDENEYENRGDYEGDGDDDSPSDWSRCKLPTPQKTTEAMCKLLPNEVKCNLFCIYGYTFDEGITRKTTCKYNEGKWSKRIEECKPFVDCTLKLKSAGTLKCRTNTVQDPTKCRVGCEKYGKNEELKAKVYACNASGRWKPRIPHCVEREGIDVVEPPQEKEHPKLYYP